MSCRDLPSSSMALPQAPAAPPTSYLFTPIIVVVIGIVSTAALLLIYHFIVSKYCARSRPSAPTWQQQPPKVSGVEEWVLSLIPIHDYQPGAIHIDQTECAVCLGELEEGEQVRLLPNCQHAFHVQCIDEWFIAHSNCPICRSLIVPTPPPIVFPVTTIAAVPATEGEGQLTTRSFSRDAAAPLTALPYENKLKPVCLGALKRSLSMDCSYVSHRIQLDLAQSSASSSSSRLSKGAGLKTSHSQKRLDRASTMLIRSLSRLRMGNGGAISRSLPK